MAIPDPIQGEATTGNPYGDSPYGGTERLRIKSAPAFFLCHDPSAWERASDGLDGETWLPNFYAHQIRGGSAGNRTLSKHESEQGQKHRAYEDALATVKRRGIVVLDGTQGRPGPTTAIPAQFVPPIPDEYASHLPARPGYAVRYPSVDPRRGVPGEHWTELWDVPQPGIAGRDVRKAFHGAEYNRWRLWLVETGIIDPPAQHVVDEGLAIVAKRLERASAHPDPAIRADKVKVHEAALKAAEAAIVPDIAEDAAPKRPPRRAKKPQDGEA